MTAVGYDLSIPGWMTEPELQWLYQTASQMESVVEIGCCEGRSTFALLQGCKGPVYAVDPWTYVPWLDINHDGVDNLRHFIRNLQNRGARNPLYYPMTSAEAVAFMPGTPRGIPKVDMTFIDGNHEEPFVLQDIDLWLPKTRILLCGHDFGNPDWPGVTKAVQERFAGRFSNPVGLIWAVWLDIPVF
jgi:hypothetical protein